LKKAFLMEPTIMPLPLQPERGVVTTCAYCGVGCALQAQTRAGRIVRMLP